jgi:hypothetical protein
MSIRKVFSTIFGIAVLSMLAGLANGQMTDPAARELARNAVRSQLHLKSDQFLNVQRDERLEQSLASAVGKRAGSEFIYRVSQAGDEVKEDAVVHHISTDADLDYIIVLGPADGSSYRIHGFADSVAEFEKLTTAVGVKVSSPEQADSLAEFYRTVNPENMPLAPISSLIELKQAAERQCHSGVKSFDTGQEAFTVWWNRAKPLYAAVPFQQKTVHHGSGYLVEWTVLSSPSGENCGGAPLRATLEVSSDGHVGKVTVSPPKKG